MSNLCQTPSVVWNAPGSSCELRPPWLSGGHQNPRHCHAEFRPALQTAVEGRSYRGPEAMSGYLEEMFDTYDVFTMAKERMLAFEDIVVTIATLHIRGRGSGMDTVSPWGFFFKMENEKVAFQQNYIDPDEALRAAGLTTTSARARD